MFYFYILVWMSLGPCVNAFFHDISHKMDKHILKGRHLLIGTAHIAPYILIEYTRGNISRVDGFVHQIVVWIAEKHHFTYEYVEPPDGAYGAFINGSWIGLVGMVVRKEINMVAAALSVTYPRSLVIDYTIPFLDDPTALLIPYPQLDSTITRIVKPFQQEVWVGIVLTLIIAAFVLWFISWVESHFVQPPPREMGWFTYLWFLFRVMANPTEVVNNFALSMKMIIGIWCLTAIVLVNSYTSSLVSHLMAPRFVPLINTAQELAESRELKIAALEFSSVDSTIFGATSGPLVKLGASLRAHPENILKDLNNAGDKVFNRRLALPLETSALKMMIHDDFKVTRTCRLFIAKEPLYPDQHAFAITKTDPMTNTFNYELIWLRQLGLLDHWAASFLPPPNRCSAPLSSKRPRTNKRLTINYLSSAFLLYGVGIAASIAAFVLENSIWWIKSYIVIDKSTSAYVKRNSQTFYSTDCMA